MADLPNADGENPKRTLVFVNHVDLYTGKSISKVRDMLLLYLFRLKNRNLKHLEQQLNSGFQETQNSLVLLSNRSDLDVLWCSFSDYE